MSGMVAPDDSTGGARTAVADPVAPEETTGEAPRSRRRPRRRRMVVACALLLVGAWWMGWSSPVSLVRHVVVEAPRGISEEAVRLASGISAQHHVPEVDAEAVRLGIMTAIPAVADVRVTRSLPDTIGLQITARTPLAALEADKGYLVMDAEGVVYDRVSSARGLTVIKARTDVGRDTARTVLLSLPPQLREDVRRVTARTRDDVTMVLRDGANVRWGSSQDAALKARVLAGLVVVKSARYDVSAPLLPTTSGTLG